MVDPPRRRRVSRERMGSGKAGLALQMLLSGLRIHGVVALGEPDAWLTLGVGPPGFVWANGLPFARSPMYPIARLMEMRLIGKAAD